MLKHITDAEANNLQREIEHIIDTGANSIRLLELFNKFLAKRELVKEFEVTKTILEKHGWTFVSEKPFKIKHTDGSFASGRAYDAMVHNIQQYEIEETIK